LKLVSSKVGYENPPPSRAEKRVRVKNVILDELEKRIADTSAFST
jgi:hypothetical protein